MKKRFTSNPIVRQIGTWLLILIIGAIIHRLTGQTKSSHKYVKNRAK